MPAVKSKPTLTTGDAGYYATPQIVKDFRVTERQLQNWRDTKFLRPVMLSGPGNACHYSLEQWAAAGIASELLAKGAKLPTLRKVLRKNPILSMARHSMASLAANGHCGFVIYVVGQTIAFWYSPEGTLEYACSCEYPVILINLQKLLGS